MSDIVDFGSFIGSFEKVLSLTKEVISNLPGGLKKKEVTKELERAEIQFRVFEGNAAIKLGYHICKCEWPPTIMKENPKYHHKCDKCGNEINTEPTIGVAKIRRSWLRDQLDHY